MRPDHMPLPSSGGGWGPVAPLVFKTSGAALGAVLAAWGTRGLLVLPLTGLPIRFQTSVDWGGLAFAMALGAGSSPIAHGAPPAAAAANNEIGNASPFVPTYASAEPPAITSAAPQAYRSSSPAVSRPPAASPATASPRAAGAGRPLPVT